MRRTFRIPFLFAVVILLAFGAVAWAGTQGVGPFAWDRTIDANARRLTTQGREIFRFDTFGSEAFWGDTLGLHETIKTVVSPALALELGLKVDVEALPASIRSALESGTLDLNDPANTVELIRQDAVVGLQGVFDGDGELASAGISCALSTQQSTTPLLPGLGTGLMAGPIGISTSARSSPRFPIFSQL